MFQTQSELKQLLADAGLEPRKRFGQHFLVDRNLMQKLLDAAELSPTDTVLEVGAGTGSLTTELATRAGHVVAVEIDQQLARVVGDQVSGLANVRLLVCDALASKSRVAPEVLEALSDCQSAAGDLKLVANLPYDVATPLVINLLLNPPHFARMCFTVQKEVGDRLLAGPGDSAYGLVSVLVGALARASRIVRAPRQAFWPPPQVESVMIRLDPDPPGHRNVANPEEFAGVLRPFFQHRRKTLAHVAAAAGLAESFDAACAAADVDPKSRPDALSPAQWVRFAAVLSGARDGSADTPPPRRQSSHHSSDLDS